MMKDRSHASPAIRADLDKLGPEKKQRVLDAAGRDPSWGGPQIRIGTEAKVIVKPVKRIKS
jgi:hypothetical protein